MRVEARDAEVIVEELPQTSENPMKEEEALSQLMEGEILGEE